MNNSAHPEQGPSPSRAASKGAPPLALDHYRSFAALAELMLHERQAADPDRVAAGKLTQAEAAQRRLLAGALAEIWGCIRDPRRTPQARFLAVTRRQLLDTLDSAIAVAERRALRDPSDKGRAHQLEQLRAMAWWHARLPERAHAHNMICDLVWQARQLGTEAEAPAQGEAA
jgi:hypothetical protein